MGMGHLRGNILGLGLGPSPLRSPFQNLAEVLGVVWCPGLRVSVPYPGESSGQGRGQLAW